jgi:hypothetical protein
MNLRVPYPSLFAQGGLHDGTALTRCSSPFFRPFLNPFIQEITSRYQEYF